MRQLLRAGDVIGDPMLLPMPRLVASLMTMGAFFFASGAAAAPGDPLPTPEEIHQTFDQQQYPQVLQKLQRVLQLKGLAAKPYDRHDLLRLKGETHLRMKAA